MKILKPGKVEQRKFTCPKCGCVFVARAADLEQDRFGTWVICQQDGCEYNFRVSADSGEPYEEPVQDDRERLAQLLAEAMFNSNNIGKQADYLIENGVTFREV